MHFFLGFSLLELMITVAIIGILTALALPSYERYSKRARFTEVLNAGAYYKTIVALNLQEGISIDELNNGKHGLPEFIPATKNLESVSIDHGIITATATQLIDHLTYVLTPSSDGTTWTMSGSCLAMGFCHD